MASVYKNVEIAGTVGNVYELRTVGADNKSVIDFSIAVTPRRRDKDGEWVDGRTVWTNCTAWGKTAENIAEGFNSGDRVFVKGRADMKDGYTNKDGVEVPAREIVIVDVAGHDNSYYPTSQDRNHSGGAKKTTAEKPAASKPASQKDDPVESDDIDLDLNLDDFDSSELPF